MTLLISLHSFVVLNRLFDGHLQAAILKSLTLPYLSTEWAESGEVFIKRTQRHFID